MKTILESRRHEFLTTVSIFLVTIALVMGLVGCGQLCTLTMFSTSGGNVSVMKADTASWIEAQVGMSLEPGDIIKSGDSSSAEITFIDGTTIELQAGTEIEIVSLDISTDTGSATIVLRQTIGSIIFRVIKLIDPASRYEVETPTGAVAVRGSAMQVYVLEDGTTWACNLEGDIWAIAQGVELQVPEGRCCIITPGQPPELVEEFSSEPAANAELDQVKTAGLGYFAEYGYWPDTSDDLTPEFIVGTLRATYEFDTQYGWVLDATPTVDGWTGITFESGLPGPTGNHGRWVELLTLLSPAAGSTAVPITNIDFTWTEVTGADEYDWVLCLDPDLSSPIATKIGLTTVAYTYIGPALAYDTPYYWKVTAYKEGAFITSSPLGTFTTIPAPP